MSALHVVPDRLVARLPARLADRLGDHDRAVIPLVRLHGVIAAVTGPGPRSVINSVTTEKVLERAFDRERLAAVGLLINSPGGSPTQSALVADRIRGLADERGVPVFAFCEDVAASGGYWLACAADEIYAHPTSIIGSIGVVSQSFGLEGLLQRIGVERRLYTAGEAKARLDPFLPRSEEHTSELQSRQYLVCRLLLEKKKYRDLHRKL